MAAAATTVRTLWDCPECGLQVAIPIRVESSGPIVDESGKTVGVDLTPIVDTSPASRHLALMHGATVTA